MLAAVNHVGISVIGIFIGLALGVLVYVLAIKVFELIGIAQAQAAAAILAIVVFILCAFSFN